MFLLHIKPQSGNTHPDPLPQLLHKPNVLLPRQLIDHQNQLLTANLHHFIKLAPVVFLRDLPGQDFLRLPALELEHILVSRLPHAVA